MRILSIETSCDETSLALIDIDNAEVTVHAHNTLSQIDIHREYGGVFPSLAKREHGQNLTPLLIKTLEESGFGNSKLETRNAKQIQNSKFKILKSILEREPELYGQFMEKIAVLERPDIDAIAVTHGPGLEPALWVGINFAKALNALWNMPVIPVNHMEGHVASVLLNESENSNFEFRISKQQPAQLRKIEFPAVALLVSGGHTELVLVNDWGQYEILGQTLDDAVGEAFDKVARLLDLPYPGGPGVSRLAAKARENDTESPFSLPRPMMQSGDLNFSFSGLKTAVRYGIEKLPSPLTDQQKEGVAREFEDAVVDSLVAKTTTACKAQSVASLVVAGGVAANTHLTQKLSQTSTLPPIHIAPQSLSGDNALMIAIAGYKRSRYAPDKLMLDDPRDLEAIGNLSLEEPLRIAKKSS